MMPIAQAPKARGQWRLGRLITGDVPQPLVYTLDPDYPGTPKAMYYEQAIPIVREDVIGVLNNAGVDNIQYFDAVLRNPKTGEDLSDYRAYNIVGLVAAADVTSELMGTSASTMGDVDFHALVIDESKARGLLVFRLAEATNAVVVHNRVRTAMQDAGIPGFVFYGPGEWSG